MTYRIPEGYSKKEFFAQPKLSDLSHLQEVMVEGDLESLIHAVHRRTATQRLIFRSKAIGNEASRYFKKHAPVIDLTNVTGKTPLDRLKRQLGRKSDYRIAGYGWYGDDDKVMRVVPLVEVLKAAKLFAFESVKHEGGIDRIAERDTMLYTVAWKIEEQGAAARVSVSSRNPSGKSYAVVLRGVPMNEKNDWRNITAPGSCCEHSKYLQLRFTGLGDPHKKIFCAHEINAYWKAAVAAYDREGEGPHNRVPTDYSPFFLPAQEMIAVYQALSMRTLALVPKSGEEVAKKFTPEQIKAMTAEERLKKLYKRRFFNDDEIEMALHAYAKLANFSQVSNKRGKLAERSWIVV